MTLKLSPLRWLVTLVGVQFLAGTLWVLGPSSPWLDQPATRAVAILALLVAWGAGNLVLDWRRNRKETLLEAGLTGASLAEAAAVEGQFADALAQLRRAGGRKALLHEQPWWAIIGPPGSGKTTALANAGLSFSLAKRMPGAASLTATPAEIAGVGGTGLYKWWFTGDGVLIDTAGRYTAQDSDAAIDRAGWQAFLALLRRSRPRQPLNGVLVAIALEEAVDPAKADIHARMIRARIDELDAAFDLRLPLYVLLTKVDLLAGFTEFFDDLDDAGRDQVWGATFPLDPLLAAPARGGMFGPLLERLNRRVYHRLDTERSADRRAVIAAFPAQFASALPGVQAFLDKAFGTDPAGRTPLLRGVFLTSGTQGAQPIDRAAGGLARGFGLASDRMPQARPSAGRSYFMSGVLRRIVFAEALLVSSTSAGVWRKRVARTAGLAACAAFLVGGATALLVLRSQAASSIMAQRQALATAAMMASALPLDPVADADFARLVPWLDTLRRAAGAESGRPDPLGFSQDATLRAAAADAYRRALHNALLPRLVWRVEEQLRGAAGQTDTVYEATRIYLMLGGAGPLDRTAVRDWFADDWARAIHGPDDTTAWLMQHLDSLMEGTLPPVTLDGPLLAQARLAIGQTPLAHRTYARLKRLAAENRPASWRLGEAIGPVGLSLFTRRSGAGLDGGIDGIFTVDGLRFAVLPALARATRDMSNEGWVFGEATAQEQQPLAEAVLQLYAEDYAAAWQSMLDDLDLMPLRSLSQAAQDLFILASAQSPIRRLLASASAQLAPAALARSGKPSDTLGLGRLALVDDQFATMRRLVTTTGPAPIDLVLRPLGDLQQQLAKQAASTVAAPATAAGDPAAALRSEALRQPQPLARWLVAMATGGAALRAGGPRGAMIATWNGSTGGGALCPTMVADRYPFSPAATNDIAIDDFTRLFGPGGAIDGFFNTQLRPYVDTTARPWKLRPGDGATIPLTPGDLLQFQRAAEIRDLFFPASAQQPRVRFDIKPAATDPSVAAAWTSASLP